MQKYALPITQLNPLPPVHNRKSPKEQNSSHKENSQNKLWINQLHCVQHEPCHSPMANRSPSASNTLFLSNIPTVQEDGDQPHPAPVTAVNSVKLELPIPGGTWWSQELFQWRQTGTFWEQIFWSITDICLRISWTTFWKFPFSLVNCKGSMAAALASSNINVWLLDALSWRRNISPLAEKVVEERWVAAAAFLGNARYYTTC